MLRLSAPCEAIACNSGRRAVQLAIERQPDVVILDLNLPDMDGFETRAAMVSALTAKMPAFVALTGLVQITVVESRLAPFDAVLTKPVDVDELTSAVGC